MNWRCSAGIVATAQAAVPAVTISYNLSRRRSIYVTPPQHDAASLISYSPDVLEPGAMSSLSQRSMETLLGLVEIKLSCLEVYDREDAREKSYLENAWRELGAIKSHRLAVTNPVARAAAWHSWGAAT